MIIASDASPLILYARAGHLWLLRQVFKQVWIPPRVAGETFRDRPEHPGAMELAALVGTWLREVRPADDAAVGTLARAVDRGEAEAIVLASEHGLRLLIDDSDGRLAAGHRGHRQRRRARAGQATRACVTGAVAAR